MTNGITINQRDIIIMPFPFSDLSQSKKRPAIILSNKDYNSNNEDVICCAITSNPRNYANSIKIESTDLDSGRLLVESIVKPTKVFTLSQNLIIKKIATLNVSKSKEIVKKLDICIEIE